jgi:hypothetical protein
MEQAFARFLNDRKWTTDVFTSEERIDCNLVITIESMPTVGFYNAAVQVQSSRPIYNTSYSSLLLNFADRDWQFEYIESTPLDYGDNVFTSNIASMLAFYAYIILGLDYDSFALKGGDQIFQRALNLVNLAQNADRPGWQAFESNRNRYWLIENLTNQQLQSIREGIYTYHRLALDVFLEKPAEARQQIIAVLADMQEANRQLPNSILKIAFFDAKADELVHIFSEGSPAMKREAYNILADLDPTNTTKYQQMIGN